MATWELTIDNRANTSTTIYVMEIDILGGVKTPADMWSLVVGDTEPWKTNLAKRLYHSIIFGASTDFPAICKAITPRSNTEKLIVSKDTTALQVWTFSDGTWTAKDNITNGLADRAIVAIPLFETRINATIFPTTANTYDAAIDGYYKESRSGHLILASEISADPYNLTSGTINSLSFKFSGWTRAAAQKPLQTIKLWHTDAITLNRLGPNFEGDMILPAPEGSSEPDFTIDLPDKPAYVAVPLTTPFVWNGSQNIFIIWDNRGGDSAGYGVGYGETSSISGLNRVWASNTITISGNLAEMQNGAPSTHGRFDMQFGNG